MDITACTSKTVLGQLLSRIRTCSDGTNTRAEQSMPLALRSCDFFGSPLRDTATVARIRPYPDLFRTGDKHPRCYPERFPVRDDNKQWVVGDWPLSPAPNDVPEALIVFQEVLRCIAAPLLDAEPVEHADEGFLRPGFLPGNYFAHRKFGDDVSENKSKHRTAFRYSILKSYTLLLLRRLAEIDGRFIKWILLEVSHEERVERFQEALNSSSEEWNRIIRLASQFLGSRPYEEIFIEHCFLDTLQGLDKHCRVLGRPRDQTDSGSIIDINPQGASLLLPQTLSALIHLCIDRLGLSSDDLGDEKRTGKPASMYPDNKGELLKDVLSDTNRLHRAEELLQLGAWKEYSFKIGNNKNGKQGADRGPSIRLAYWVCFCVVLEALIAGDLAPDLSVDIDPDLGPARHLGENAKGEIVNQNSDHGSPKKHTSTANRDEKVAIMKTEISTLARTASSRSTERPKPKTRGDEARQLATAPSGYLPPDTLRPLPDFNAPRFEFLKTPAWSLDEEQFAEIYCPVERDDDGNIPLGGIWLPLADHLIASGATVEVITYRFDEVSGPDQEPLVQMNIGIADEFLHDDGVLLSLEPEDWDDSNLLSGYGLGEFDTISLLGLVGEYENPERILVMIVCLPNTALKEGG